jgi:hypothetical protein
MYLFSKGIIDESAVQVKLFDDASESMLLVS